MHFDDPMYLLSQGCGIVKDVIHSNHLGKNGAIAEGVAECNQPGGDIAHHSNNLWVGGNKEIDTCVQDDGPTTYQINFRLLRRINLEKGQHKPGGDNTIHFVVLSSCLQFLPSTCPI